MRIKSSNHSPFSITCNTTDIMLRHVAVTVGFFYKTHIEEKRLRIGLEQALNHFPIFSAVIENSDNNGLLINCNNKGASFQVTHHDLTLTQALKQLSDKTFSQKLFDIIDVKNAAKNRETVLKIKTNYFKNGGMCLGICWHHAIGDMHTFMLFMKTFSKIISGKKLSEKPLIVKDRHAYVKSFVEDKHLNTPGIRHLKGLDAATLILYMLFKAKKKVKQQFYFTPAELNAMKKSYIEKGDCEFSTNDVICAHMFSMISSCSKRTRNRDLSIAINYRSRIGLSDKLSGNMIDNIILSCAHTEQPTNIAKQIRNAVDRYSVNEFKYFANERYIEKEGGKKNIARFITKSLDPVKGTVLMTNWSKFGVYEIEFDQEKPVFFTSQTAVPFPWICNAVEGFSNQGLIFTTNLPSAVAAKLSSTKSLAKIHQYRRKSDNVPEWIANLSWLY